MRELLDVHRWRPVVAVGIFVAGALAIGLALVVHPVAGVLLAVGAVGVAMGVARGRDLPGAFLSVMGVILVGYAALGRGFAYLGVPPAFVGELTLALGLFAVVAGGLVSRSLKVPLAGAIVAFMAWGAFNTVPYLGAHGLDALRDAVIWGYAVFALLTAAALLETGWWAKVPRAYARVLPWLLFWLPVAVLLTDAFRAYVPVLPWTEDITLVRIKPGDVAVHLTGIATFMLLGLHRRSREGWTPFAEWTWWLVWIVTLGIVGSQNRGGLLAAILGIGVVMALRPSVAPRWGKALFLAVVIGVVTTLAPLETELIPRRGRDVSPRQFVENVASVVGLGGGEEGALEGTREWRLEWWSDIVGYTVLGPHFWTGKGYGINLATSDGFQLYEESEALRSPHNAHITVLARSGVPGLVLWLVLQGGFAFALLGAWRRARARGRDTWARIDVWILGYWTAFMVNASFDVFLEGPQGGIWFWALFGFGLAAIAVQRRIDGGDRPAPARVSTASAAR